MIFRNYCLIILQELDGRRACLCGRVLELCRSAGMHAFVVFHRLLCKFCRSVIACHATNHNMYILLIFNAKRQN